MLTFADVCAAGKDLGLARMISFSGATPDTQWHQWQQLLADGVTSPAPTSATSISHSLQLLGGRRACERGVESLSLYGASGAPLPLGRLCVCVSGGGGEEREKEGERKGERERKQERKRESERSLLA
jgi:hypothetical protein